MEQNSINTQLKKVTIFSIKTLSCYFLFFNPGSIMLYKQVVNHLADDVKHQNFFINLNSNDKARFTCSLLTKQKNKYTRDIIFTDKHEIEDKIKLIRIKEEG